MSSSQLEKFALVKPAEIEWRDGLPFSLEFDDVYFSIHGAIEESTHVFIEGNQLCNDWNNFPEKDFSIVELGFGSGLNFFNTVSHWLNQQSKQNEKPDSSSFQHLNYIAIEKRPFTKEDLIIVSERWPQFKKISQQLIENYPSQTYGRHQIIFSDWNITLTLMWMPLKDAFSDLINESKAQENKTKIDHWFLDGFAPQKNESMWESKNAFQIAELSITGSRIATYSVAGSVKRPLIDAGFEIIKRKGFAKKREMLTAVFTNNNFNAQESKYINLKHDRPWFNIGKTKKAGNSTSSVAIIGAGIAGCATAYCLSNKGFVCDIYESKPEIANGASGAAAGIFHPQLTSDMNLGSQFNWLAYLTLLRFLSSLSSQERNMLIISEGVHRFLDNKHSKQQLITLSNNYNLTDWIKENNFNEKNNLDAIKNDRKIYFPHSAALDIPALCQLYLDKTSNESLQIYTNSKIESLVQKNNLWLINCNQKEKVYQHVVFCGGARSNLLSDLNITSTHTTRGQTCLFNSKILSENLQQTISEQIYLVPQKNKINKQSNQFLLGSTFDNFEEDKLKIESQHEILNKTSKLLKELSFPHFDQKTMTELPLAGTVGYRLHSNDRLPIVGGAVDHQKLADTFSKYGQKRILRQELSNYNLPGLWVNTAYGSHGLLHSLLASNHLTSLISSNISPLDYNLSNRLSPVRYTINQLKQSQK